MLLKDIVKIVAVTALLTAASHPCEMVIIGGERPQTVAQIAGSVVGSGRVDLMGKDHDKERQSLTVSGATVSVLNRVDITFIGEGEVPVGMESASGNLKDWRCGDEVAKTRTDEAGNFTVEQVEPGRYCLVITGSKPNEQDAVSMRATFPIDVIPSAPKAKLIANISPRWSDCSGGQSLELAK